MQQVKYQRNPRRLHTDAPILLKMTPLLLALLQIAAYVHFQNNDHKSSWEQEKQEHCITSMSALVFTNNLI